jgi:hypothetical protein
LAGAASAAAALALVALGATTTRSVRTLSINGWEYTLLLLLVVGDVQA